jgi:uncharacterized phage infection (PIP) family protein YhgE
VRTLPHHTTRNATTQFREELESAVEGALTDMTKEVVTAVWNACDDQRGELQERINQLHTELKARPTRAEVLRKAADELDEDDYLGAADELRRMADAAERGEGRD